MAHGRGDSFLVVLYLQEAVIRNKKCVMLELWKTARSVVHCKKRLATSPLGTGLSLTFFFTEWEECLLVLYTARSRLVTCNQIWQINTTTESSGFEVH